MDNAKTARLKPFNVTNQTAAHRLALEGFELVSVIPSNKSAEEAQFIFTFNATADFKKRYKEILAEAEERENAEKERLAEAAAELERLRAENEELKRLSAENTAETAPKTEEYAGIDAVMDKLAELEALGNCILSNVAALEFFKHLRGEGQS